MALRLCQVCRCRSERPLFRLFLAPPLLLRRPLLDPAPSPLLVLDPRVLEALLASLLPMDLPVLWPFLLVFPLSQSLTDLLAFRPLPPASQVPTDPPAFQRPLEFLLNQALMDLPVLRPFLPVSPLSQPLTDLLVFQPLLLESLLNQALTDLPVLRLLPLVSRDPTGLQASPPFPPEWLLSPALMRPRALQLSPLDLLLSPALTHPPQARLLTLVPLPRLVLPALLVLR